MATNKSTYVEGLCSSCNLYKHNIVKSNLGHGRKCRDCINSSQRKSRKKNNSRHTKVYEKTKKGFVMRLYRNMKSRIEGVQKLKSHLYEGKELLSKQDFYEFALSSEDFNKLFKDYKNSQYIRGLAPSPNRIDSDIGYILGNIEFITMSENSRLGAINKANKLKSNK